MDTATLVALWRQCAPPTQPWHSDAGESALLHLRVAHYLRHLTLQLHNILRESARVRWEIYTADDARGHVGLCGINITPHPNPGQEITLEWAWNAQKLFGVLRCPQLDLSTQPIALDARDTDLDRSLLAILPSMFVHVHSVTDAPSPQSLVIRDALSLSS